jgi:hypothetical protein
MGPSLLIAACLVLAIRMAKRPAVFNTSFSDVDLEGEIQYSIHLAHRVLSMLMSHDETIFPRLKELWYRPNGEDHPSESVLKERWGQGDLRGATTSWASSWTQGLG